MAHKALIVSVLVLQPGMYEILVNVGREIPVASAAGSTGPQPAAPKPRVNLTRFHGVFSRGGHPPNSKLRSHVVPQQPAAEQESSKPKACAMDQASPPCATAQARIRHRSERGPIEKCEKCGGPVRIIASIEDRDVIQRILKHLGLDQPDNPQSRSPPARLQDQATALF